MSVGAEGKKRLNPQNKVKFKKARQAFFDDVLRNLSKRLLIHTNQDDSRFSKLSDRPVEVLFSKITAWESKHCLFLNKLPVSPQVIRFVRDIIRGATNVVVDRRTTKDVPLDVVICLTIWYLSKTDPVVRSVRLFKLYNLKEANRLIQYGLSLIIKLKKQCDLTLPEYAPYLQDSSDHFGALGFPGVVGVVGNKRLSSSRSEQQYSLWYIVNEKRTYKSIEHSLHASESDALKKPANFIRELNLIPPEYKVIGLPTILRWKDHYSFKSKIVTLSNDERNEDSDLALGYEKAINIGDTAIRETLARFPRVTKLKWQFHETILAACIMHNFCIMFMDEEFHSDAQYKYN